MSDITQIYAQRSLERQERPRLIKRPSMVTLERWSSNGIAKATDGCQVEPDGHCPHGCPSWLIELGYI